MMATVHLICGKIASGKTTYAKQLQKEYGAVLLSVDDLDKMLFHQALKDRYDTVLVDMKAYLHALCEQMLCANCDVVLDWGFWQRAERDEVSERYASKGFCYQWYYVNVAEDVWHQRIGKRNGEVQLGQSDAYFLDEGLLSKMQALFESPMENEIQYFKCIQ